MLQQYQNSTFDQVNELRTWLGIAGEGLGGGMGGAAAQSKIQDVMEDVVQLKLERNTWNLLLRLHIQMLKERDQPYDPSTDPLFTISPGREEEVLTVMLKRRIDLQRWREVVLWYEENAKDFTYNEAKGVHYWGETQRAITGRRGNFVKQLDPDAPSRLNAALAEGDADDETRLLQGVWLLLRSGQIDKANNLCVEYGQSWRASSLRCV